METAFSARDGAADRGFCGAAGAGERARETDAPCAGHGFGGGTPAPRRPHRWAHRRRPFPRPALDPILGPPAADQARFSTASQRPADGLPLPVGRHLILRSRHRPVSIRVSIRGSAPADRASGSPITPAKLGEPARGTINGQASRLGRRSSGAQIADLPPSGDPFQDPPHRVCAGKRASCAAKHGGLSVFRTDRDCGTGARRLGCPHPVPVPARRCPLSAALSPC